MPCHIENLRAIGRGSKTRKQRTETNHLRQQTGEDQREREGAEIRRSSSRGKNELQLVFALKFSFLIEAT